MGKPFNHSTSDADLIAAMQGDRSDDAFSVLYDRHTPRAFQTAWHILGGDSHLAEDAVQDAWIRAVAGLDVWSRNEAFGAWLRGITVHVAIDLLRREVRLTFTDDIDEAMAEQDVEHIDLERAIAALAPGYRAVLVLHDVEGFTHEEIAEQLGITAGTSKGQLFKARRAVRARLAARTVEKA
ncbi:MAG TPA: RNA polymerase sigma factor [Gemmatimonadaceae bacterium]|jgi:RNA polymerase sigma-70 factor (ECF subfamily)